MLNGCRHVDDPRIIYTKTSSLFVETEDDINRPVMINLDGEYGGEAPMHFQNLHQHIEFFANTDQIPDEAITGTDEEELEVVSKEFVKEVERLAPLSAYPITAAATFDLTSETNLRLQTTSAQKTLNVQANIETAKANPAFRLAVTGDLDLTALKDLIGTEAELQNIDVKLAGMKSWIPFSVICQNFISLQETGRIWCLRQTLTAHI